MGINIEVGDEEIWEFIQEELKKQMAFVGKDSKYLDLLLASSCSIALNKKDQVKEYNQFVNLIKPVCEYRHIAVIKKEFDECSSETEPTLHLQVMFSPERLPLSYILSNFNNQDPYVDIRKNSDLTYVSFDYNDLNEKDITSLKRLVKEHKKDCSILDRDLCHVTEINKYILRQSTPTPK